MDMSKKAVLDGVADVTGTLTVELGVVLRLRDCLPSRDLGLLFPTDGGIFGEFGLGRTIWRGILEGDGSLSELRKRRSIPMDSELDIYTC